MKFKTLKELNLRLFTDNLTVYFHNTDQSAATVPNLIEQLAQDRSLDIEMLKINLVALINDLIATFEIPLDTHHDLRALNAAQLLSLAIKLYDFYYFYIHLGVLEPKEILKFTDYYQIARSLNPEDSNPPLLAFLIQALLTVLKSEQELIIAANDVKVKEIDALINYLTDGDSEPVSVTYDFERYQSYDRLILQLENAVQSRHAIYEEKTRESLLAHLRLAKHYTAATSDTQFDMPDLKSSFLDAICIRPSIEGLVNYFTTLTTSSFDPPPCSPARPLLSTDSLPAFITTPANLSLPGTVSQPYSPVGSTGYDVSPACSPLPAPNLPILRSRSGLTQGIHDSVIRVLSGDFADPGTKPECS